jgi:hypothetical protein
MRIVDEGLVMVWIVKVIWYRKSCHGYELAVYKMWLAGIA